MLKLLCDDGVDPRAVPQLNAEVQYIDHGEMLHADLVILQVLEDEADDANNLLLGPEIEHLCDILDHVELKVLEVRHSILVIAENPEAAANVVSDLGIVLAITSQEALECTKAIVSDKDSSEFVEFEEVQEAVSVSLTRQLLGLVLCVQELSEELLCSLFVVFVATVRNQLSKSVGSEIANPPGFIIDVAHVDTHENVDAVALL